MAAAAFWRDLEARFRELQTRRDDELRAEWNSIGRPWLLRGDPIASVLRRFKQTAGYTAKRKGQDTQEQQTRREFLDEWVRAVNNRGGFD